MTARIGGLCFGYGGLDLAVQQVIPDAELAWYAEYDKGASKIGAHRFPGVPNYGDMTKIDWSAVEPVDILTGGTPCQDLSHAGKRAGMTEGTRSNLWVAMREAIATIRPSLVIWENVRGAYTATADSALVADARLLADVRRRRGEPVLRALGRVLGDLSELGYDAEWRGLRAADVGAPHGRFRVFVVAWPTDAHDPRRSGIGGLDAVRRDAHRRGRADGPRATGEPAALLPSPRTSDTNGAGAHGDGGLDLRTAISLLGTPTARDHKGDGNDWRLEAAARRGHVEAQVRSAWGRYAAAVRRWELLTRLAPAPTELGPSGTARLSARFSEWMMGLPDGWVTDVPGITRNEALKALGNGVVPQQAAAAIDDCLRAASREVAA